MRPSTQRRTSHAARLLGALGAIALFSACSSDDTSSQGDGGASDAAAEGGATFPTCVGEGGYQCQPKGCLSGFVEMKGYDCGNNSTGSCCAKGAPTLDAGSDGPG